MEAPVGFAHPPDLDLAMTSDAPPKQTVNGTEAIRMDEQAAALPRYQDQQTDPDLGAAYSEASALVSLQPGGRQGDDSFPVLKAFQDYLEAERIRSSQRTTMLTAIFATIVVVILITFGLIWHSAIQSARERETMLLQMALAGKGQQPVVNVAAPAPAEPAEDTAAIVAAAVSKAQADQAALFAEKLESMTKLVATIQQDNANMKAALAKNTEPAPVAKQPAPVAKAAPVVKPAPAAKAAPAKTTAKAKPVLAIPTVPPPPSPQGFASGSFGVRIPKEPNPLPWRIYMPMK